MPIILLLVSFVFLCALYRMLKLDSRAGSGELPSVDIVDLREELRLGNRTIFSNRLRELMSDRLAKHEQIMLFLNKSGRNGFYQ